MARIAVVGVGAVGAALAAAVQETGRHELLLCDPQRCDGLIVERPGRGPLELDAPVVTTPDAIAGPVDWVLLAVKAHQTPAAAGWLEPLVGPDTVVVALQNGVEHRERLAPLLSQGTVLPAIVWFRSGRPQPGIVRVDGETRISVDAGATGDALAAALEPAARVDRVTDLHTDAWRKLCFNAVAGLQVLAYRPAGIFANEEIAQLGRRFAVECLEVARADGAVLPDATVDEIMDRFAASNPDSATSILVDRRADRPLEWDARNGVVRRRGLRHGVPTPISDVVVPLLMAASG